MTHKAKTFANQFHNWETPQYIIDYFGPFDVDLAATAETAKAPVFFTPENSLLDAGPAALRAALSSRSCWINPPYGEMDAWVPFILRCAYQGSDVTALLPANTDTAWFHRLVNSGMCYDICFVEGRIAFLKDGIVNGPPKWNEKKQKWVKSSPGNGSVIMRFSDNEPGGTLTHYISREELGYKGGNT